MNATTDDGPGTRTLSSIEIGVLKDIGFAAVPEPAEYAAFMGFAILAFSLVRRRQNRTIEGAGQTPSSGSI